MTHEAAAEFLVEPAIAQQLIERQFPALGSVHVRRIGEGWDNVAYVVDERYVFRFPRRTIAVPLIEIEARVLPLIAPQLPLAIPVPRFVGVASETYPWPFAGYAVLSGRTADERELSDEERRGLATPLGAFLRALHGIDPAPAVAHGLKGDELGRLSHARRMPLARERLARLADERVIDDAAPFLTFLERIAPQGSPPHACIVHGDLYLRHLLVDDDGGLRAVIDWGDIHLGDPALDLAVAPLVLPADAHETFRAAYGPIDEAAWTRARYRAVYHAAMQANYGLEIGDERLVASGRWALRALAAALSAP